MKLPRFRIFLSFNPLQGKLIREISIFISFDILTKCLCLQDVSLPYIRRWVHTECPGPVQLHPVEPSPDPTTSPAYDASVSW